MTIKSYLKENIDEHIELRRWQDMNSISIFLRNNYNFYEMVILGNKCILMELKDEMLSIDALQKHIKQVKTQTEYQIVLFYKEMSRYRRKSLIENRISFVIEEGQMYLPFLGLDLNKTKDKVEKKAKYFSKSTQLAYLYFLYHKNDVVNMTEFAEKFGITNMTASRALNDLYYANLITYEKSGKTGRSKAYKRIPDPDYYMNGHIYFRSPVKKIIYARTKPLGALNAGLDALADLSMINPPDHPIIAISKELYEKLEVEIITDKDRIKDEQFVEIQLWDYDPQLFSKKHHVDLMSLSASLKNENDERIEQALEELLRGESWYTDYKKYERCW